VSFGVWTLRLKDAERAFALEASRAAVGGVVAKLRGLEDRDAAREWTGAEIVVPRSQLPAAAEGEVYWADLEGLEVRNTVGGVLGKVEGLFATGAHAVLVVRGERERLIPFVAGQTVVRVDLAERVIVVDWAADY
jgi:16S rRNA processing protein RimM